MEGPPIKRSIHGDGAIALVGPHQVGCDGACPGSGIRWQRLVLILRKERGAKVDRVDVRIHVHGARPEGVVAVLPHVFDVHGRGPRQHHLEPAVPLHGGWQVHFILVGVERRRRQGRAAAGERLQRAVPHRRIDERWRILDEVEGVVAAGAIEVNPAAATQDELLVPRHVVGHTHARGHGQRWPSVGS